MFIERLIIEKNDNELVRDIEFHKGLNLIIDKTLSTNKKSSGNDVGKTTLLKLIDYCLGSNGKNIFTDKEFGGDNNTKYTIRDYLENNKILVTLVLSDNLYNSDLKIVIKRNFLSNKNSIFNINNKEVKLKADDKDLDANCLLKKLIFNSKEERPTFRQIISKNIRYEHKKIDNVVKILDFASNNEYEALYLFWFGIPTDLSKEKENIKTERDLEKKIQNKLEDTESELRQKLNIKIIEILEKEKQKDKLNINKNYKIDLDKLDSVKKDINYINSRISSLNTRKNLILESKEELQKNKKDIDTNTIKYLYIEAKRFFPNIHKSFEEVLDFHNSMIKNKIDFITNEIPNLDDNIKRLYVELENKLKEEENYTKILRKTSTIDELNDIIRELNILYEEKGVLEEKLNVWKDSTKKINILNDRLKEIDKKNESYKKIIDSYIDDFNLIFSDISNKLYGEKLILTLEQIENKKSNTKNYTINIKPYENKPSGSGRKITEIQSFDLSYIKFADKHNIKCLHFILQDDIEKVHDNQINNLILDVLDDINCQYIIPILRDKLPENIDIEKYEILTLSQNDKLFKF